MLRRFSELGDDGEENKIAQFSAESGRELIGNKNGTANAESGRVGKVSRTANAASGRVGKVSREKIRTANAESGRIGKESRTANAESGRVGSVSIDKIGKNNWKRKRTSYNPIPIILKEMRE